MNLPFSAEDVDIDAEIFLAKNEEVFEVIKKVKLIEVPVKIEATLDTEVTEKVDNVEDANTDEHAINVSENADVKDVILVDDVNIGDTGDYVISPPLFH